MPIVHVRRGRGADEHRALLDVLVVIHEPPLENWGVRGGQAASDLQLGFKLDV